MVSSKVDFSDPSTWPFSVWIGSAFFLFIIGKSVWDWWKERRSASWPIVTSTIVYGQVVEKSGVRSKGDPGWRAQIYYSYTANGEKHERKYERQVEEEEGRALVAGLEGKIISVHVNPENDGESHVNDDEIDRVAAERPPHIGPPQPATDFWKSIVALPLAAISLMVFGACTWVHVAAILGKELPPDWLMTAMMGLVILLLLPATFLATGRRRSNDITRAFKGTWLLYPASAIFTYGMASFLYCWARLMGADEGPEKTMLVWRAFTGHGMIFSFVAFGMYFLVVSPPEQDIAR